MIARTLLASCVLCLAPPLVAHAQAMDQDKIHHYSVMDALRNGVYQGELAVKDVAAVGDFGLGIQQP